MTSPNNSFDWRNEPSQIGKALGRTQTAPKTKPVPIVYSKKPAHHLRKAEASKVCSTSRAATANINTEAPKSRRVSRAGI